MTLYDTVIHFVRCSHYDEENYCRISEPDARDRINEMSMIEFLEAISSALEDMEIH